MIGAFTDDIDLIQVLLVAFVLFFAGLVLYLRREDKREGYPLEATTGRRGYAVIGWPAPPPPKRFRLLDGGTATMPHRIPQAPIEGVRPPPLGGSLAFGGPPLLSGLGAGAYVLRSETPARTLGGLPLLAPLRRAPEWSLAPGETDPRGMVVLGRDLARVGTVADLWVDRTARLLRYLELDLDAGGIVLLPIFHAAIDRRDRPIRVGALKSGQFAYVPRLADPDLMTPREEDRLTAFYAGGTIYADSGPEA